MVNGIRLPTGRGPLGVELIDVNADGRSDLVVTHQLGRIDPLDDVPRCRLEWSVRGSSPDAVVDLFDELNHIFDARSASHRAIVKLRLNGEPILIIARTVPCCQRTAHRVLATFKQDVAERFAV